jgi:uncharacterized protein (TIGR03084 family)
MNHYNADDITTDLRAEHAQLADLCRTLTQAQWRVQGDFYGWTPWDEIAHLMLFDEKSLLAIFDPEGFARDAAALNPRLAAGEEISAIARKKYGDLDGTALLEQWVLLSDKLVNALGALDPKARLPWYGPTMSVRSFATARLMETWAHGQDIFDAVGLRRLATPRLKHIAHIGVTTFAWSFANRHLAVPAMVPFVELSAPNGGVWTWGDSASTEFVRGSAEDFCLIVTQRRNLADTGLQYSKGSAREWLAITQCFAGPPADGPKPGLRKPAYSA